MIITISSLKGGVGKSTITQNLAVYFAHEGYSVAILDTDVNESSLYWSGDRPDTLPYIYVASIPDGKALGNSLKGLNDNYDIVLIDGSPAVNALTSRIIAFADLLVIPIKGGLMDLRATEKFIDRYDEAIEKKGEEIPAYFLFNEYKKGYTVSKQTEDVLKESDIKTFKARLGDRTAFTRANGEGLGVIEYKDKKAKEELLKLGKEIHKIVKKL